MSKRLMTIQELQKTEVEILQAFHLFCEKHHLRYYLGGGTAIGAIRHHGFIPWDDDIDVMMPRPDYVKFQQLCPNGMLDAYRKLDSRQVDPDCPSAIVRIYDTRTEITFDNFRIPYTIGCWIDVFCIDGVESDPKKRKKQFREMRVANDLFICCLTKFGGKRRSKMATILQYALLPALPFIRAVGYKKYLRWIDDIAKRHDFDACEYVGVLGGRAGVKETMKKSSMEPAQLMDFDGYQFYVAANYDEYLTNLYGDYMQLPPESERVSRHEINVYWKEGMEP